MTLRSKLLLLLVLLFAGLGVTQWFLLRSLTRELHDEAGAAAFEVGSSVATALGYSVPTQPIQPEPSASVPFTKILPPEEALIVSTRETSEGQMAVEMRLSTPLDGAPSTEVSVPALKLEPARRLDGGLEQQIPIPRRGFDEAFDRYSSSLTLGFLLLSGFGLLAAGWVALRVSAPLRGLSEAAQRLGEGEFGLQVETVGSAEIAATARAFNRMSSELQDYERLARESREREHLGEIGELARTLAHALRNPLNALGLTMDAHERELAERGERWEEASLARAQILRIEGSVRSLLAITGGEGAGTEEVRLGLLVRDVALEVMQDFGEGLDVEVVEPEALASVRAVPPELRAAVQTVLVNAAEASGKGERIEVTLDSLAPGEWAIEVLDRGPGLEPRIEGELFQPHATTKQKGTGMGLFLARRILESRYGGTLELTEREGGGVCARIVLRSRVEDPDA